MDFFAVAALPSALAARSRIGLIRQTKEGTD
jgi:hypothetical protein